MAGHGWVVVEVYEADTGVAGDVEDVLSYLGRPMAWTEATGRYAGPGRFFVRPDADGARALDEHEGRLNDDSGLAYEVVGPVSEGDAPSAGSVRGAHAAEATADSGPALRCPACGASEGFTARESYVHKLALDANGDAWDDNLGEGSDGERISTRCDSCGHEWRQDGAIGERDPDLGPGERAWALGALRAALGALEYAAHKDSESDLVYGDADDYWAAEGGEGVRAISLVRDGLRRVEGEAEREGDVRLFVGLSTMDQDHSDPLASVVVFPLRYPQVFSDDMDPDEPEKDVRDDREMMRYAEGAYDFWSIRIFGADGSYRVLPEDGELGEADADSNGDGKAAV